MTFDLSYISNKIISIIQGKFFIIFITIYILILHIFIFINIKYFYSFKKLR